MGMARYTTLLGGIFLHHLGGLCVEWGTALIGCLIGSGRCTSCISTGVPGRLSYIPLGNHGGTAPRSCLSKILSPSVPRDIADCCPYSTSAQYYHEQVYPYLAGPSSQTTLRQPFPILLNICFRKPSPLDQPPHQGPFELLLGTIPVAQPIRRPQ